VFILNGIALLASILIGIDGQPGQNPSLRPGAAIWMFARQASVNQDSLTLQDFSRRTDDYVKLRKRMQGELPAPQSGSSGTQIKQYQTTLAQKIHDARPQARQGDFFSSPISQIFRKLIAAPLHGANGGKIRASLRHAEPVRGLALEINHEYPEAAALQSTPPTLLIDLPRLPSGLEYRIVGRELVLLDSTSNLVVDLLPDALPPLQDGH
jgi:hypothetical protein